VDAPVDKSALNPRDLGDCKKAHSFKQAYEPLLVSQLIKICVADLLKDIATLSCNNCGCFDLKGFIAEGVRYAHSLRQNLVWRFSSLFPKLITFSLPKMWFRKN